MDPREAAIRDEIWEIYKSVFPSSVNRPADEISLVGFMALSIVGLNRDLKEEQDRVRSLEHQLTVTSWQNPVHLTAKQEWDAYWTMMRSWVNERFIEETKIADNPQTDDTGKQKANTHRETLMAFSWYMDDWENK